MVKWVQPIVDKLGMHHVDAKVVVKSFIAAIIHDYCLYCFVFIMKCNNKINDEPMKKYYLYEGIETVKSEK